SILLISQTLASRVATQTILLNGHFTKLGQLSDLQPHWSPTGNIHIGWKLRGFPDPGLSVGQIRSSTTELETICGDIRFGLSPKKKDKASQLNPALLDCRISGMARQQGENQNKNSQEFFIRLKRRLRVPVPEGADAADTDKSRPVPYSFDFQISMDDDAEEDLKDELAGARPVGCSFQHFLPQWLIVVFKEKEEISKAIVNVILDPVRARQAARHLSFASIQVPQEIIALLKQRAPDYITPLLSRKAQKLETETPDVPITLADLVEHTRVVSPGRRLLLRQKDPDLSTDLLAIASKVLPEKQGVSTTGLPTEELD